MASHPPSLPLPPPLPPQHRGDSSSDYYYFVITVGVIAVMLVVSNVVVFACCSPRQFVHSIGRMFRRRGVDVAAYRSEELIPVSKYRKDMAYDTECSICLTGFMEEEEVRQLPGCKHSFHAPCIDMWFYSHSSCPVCRYTVAGLPPPQRCPTAAATAEVHRPRRTLFTESSPSMSQVVIGVI